MRIADTKKRRVCVCVSPCIHIHTYKCIKSCQSLASPHFQSRGQLQLKVISETDLTCTCAHDIFEYRLNTYVRNRMEWSKHRLNPSKSVSKVPFQVLLFMQRLPGTREALLLKSTSDGFSVLDGTSRCFE